MYNSKKLEGLIGFWDEKCKAGPFKLMHEWMDKQCEVAVITRNLNAVRSMIIGKLIAFDKHWNLVIQDSKEYKFNNKKINNKKNKKDNESFSQIELINTIYSDQLMLRGDSIVMVHLVRPNEDFKIENDQDKYCQHHINRQPN